MRKGNVKRLIKRGKEPDRWIREREGKIETRIKVEGKVLRWQKGKEEVWERNRKKEKLFHLIKIVMIIYFIIWYSRPKLAGYLLNANK